MRSILDLSNNLEEDLKVDPTIVAKVNESNSYAQNLYAALCNNEFQRVHPWLILTGEKWSCSWRYAGGIVAEIQNQGDYIDWYCSGIGFWDKEAIVESDYVCEGMVTNEIRLDLAAIGWRVIEEKNNGKL